MIAVPMMAIVSSQPTLMPTRWAHDDDAPVRPVSADPMASPSRRRPYGLVGRDRSHMTPASVKPTTFATSTIA